MARSILHTIFNSRSIWAMEPSYAHGFYPFIKNLLDGNLIGAKVEGVENETPFMLDAFNPTSRIDVTNNSFDAPNAQSQQYTAVIPITGAIIKYSEECGQVGTEAIGRRIDAALASASVNSIVLKFDSGGGEGYATMNISEKIKNASKPIVAFVDGMAASAAYWIASACKEVYAAYGNTDSVGSIGTYVTLADFKAYYAKLGLPIHEIYATNSTDKNADFANALKGDYEGIIKNYIDPFNDAFKTAVATNRAGKVKNIDAVTTGKLYFAKDAVKNGLLDGIKTFQETVNRAQELATKGSSGNRNSTKNNSNFNTGDMKINLKGLGAIASFFSKKEDEEIEMTQADLERINTSIGQVNTLNASVSDLQTKLDAANATIGTLNTTIETHVQTIANKDAEIKTLGEEHPGVKGGEQKKDAKAEGGAEKTKPLKSWEKAAVDTKARLNKTK